MRALRSMCDVTLKNIVRKCVIRKRCGLMITFGLACVLSCAICIGLTIAIISGIAYGYNYSMAEFITFTRNDVTVYMRRGQFKDAADLSVGAYRRSGGEDAFGLNATADYEDHKPSARSKPLADSWLKTQDTRKYAEILTKYSPDKKVNIAETPIESELHREVRPVQDAAATVNYIRIPDNPVISILPNPLIPTVSWRSGSSEIMMRNFRPMHDYTPMYRNTEVPENLFPTREVGAKPVAILSPKENAKLRDDFGRSYVPMRVWGTTTRAIVTSDTPEDVDEDNIVYKPV